MTWARGSSACSPSTSTLPSLRHQAAGDCEHRGASSHRADPRAPRPGPAVARSGASEPGAATRSAVDPIQRDTREAGACTGGFGLAPRRAPVPSAFLATPGRFAGTIERRGLATIACLLICRGGSRGGIHPLAPGVDAGGGGGRTVDRWAFGAVCECGRHRLSALPEWILGHRGPHDKHRSRKA